MVDRAGQQIGHYRLIRLLGKGGFGEVYQAEHQLLRREQAIKILLESHFSDPAFRQRFINEAQILAKLDHPNIVHVDELGMQENMIYLVMPYIGGGTLQDRLRKHTPPLPLAEVSRYLEDTCAALGYAHQRGVVHLDLKPGNLLLHEDGRLLLSDFGLAHLIKEGAVQGGVSLAFGTPFYMAPEHLHGLPDPRSDLYALGVILFQMLSGRHPFDGSTPEAVIVKHLTEPPPLVRAIRPDLPLGLERVLGKALAKAPDMRYQTAGEMLADVKAALANQPSPLRSIAPAVFPSPTPPLGMSPVVFQSPTPQAAAPAPQMPVPPSPYAPPYFAPTVQTPHTPPASPPVAPQNPAANQPGVAPNTIIRVRGPLSGPPAAQPPPPPPMPPRAMPTPPQPQTRYAMPVQPPRPPGTLICTYRGHSDMVYVVAWSPDGRRLASASKDKTAQVWDVFTAGSIYSYKHPLAVEALAWSPDGKMLATGSADHLVQVWSDATRGTLYTYRGHTSSRSRVQGVAWASDGRRIASWGKEKTVQVWEALNGANVFVYRGHSDDVGAVAWSPDGQRLASGSDDQTVRIWYPAPVDTLRTYSAHSKAVRAVAWSPDGRLIVSASEDKTVRVWETTSGNTILIYRGHDSKAVSAVAWSPDGRRIASAGSDGAVQVWDATSGGNGYTYRGHTQEVYSLAWSPDGTRIASASKDKTVQVWQAG